MLDKHSVADRGDVGTLRDRLSFSRMQVRRLALLNLAPPIAPYFALDRDGNQI